MVKSVTLTGLRSFNKSVLPPFSQFTHCTQTRTCTFVEIEYAAQPDSSWVAAFVFLEVVVCLHMVRL
jgi:hypothetical protein